jgi:dipeptidyl aminopeptidase/acylaminoacyl peptidase
VQPRAFSAVTLCGSHGPAFGTCGSVARWFGSVGLGVVLAACGVRGAPGRPPPDRIAIVASERGPEGARLVSIDEHGDRQFELVQPAVARARDSHPAVSPDGKWIVFASSRERPLDETSLWIVPAGVAMAPRRLTAGKAIDSHPTWAPDGRAIVFASTRDAGNFDLWRLPIDQGRPGELVQLTRAAGHEVTPSVAADGTIFYAEVTPQQRTDTAPTGDPAALIEAHIEERAPDGTIRRLTSGPADSSPALSPDGAHLVFARPQLHNGEPDSELWQMVRRTEAIAPLVDLPLTDESGPVWSPDGRFVFATSVLRGADNRVVFSSVIYVDTREAPRTARILEDRVGAIPRFTPAVTALPLDVAALRGNPEYLSELAHIMQKVIDQQTVPVEEGKR